MMPTNRLAGGPGGCNAGHELVAKTPDGLEVAGILRVRLELLSKQTDVDVNSSGLDSGAITPNFMK